MEKRKPGRPAAEYPYVCGPYRVRAKWRLVIVTGRSGRRRQSYNRAFSSREAAQTWNREFQRQLRAGGRTVGDAMRLYFEHLKRKGNLDGSIDTARYRLRAILDEAMTLVDLTQTRAQQLYDALVDRGVATDTHRGSLVSGRAFGKFCVSKGWLRANPFQHVLPVGRKAKGKEQLRIDESRQFLAYCLAAWRADKDRAAVASLLALMFSMRANEVAQLKTIDIDDRGRVLRIAERRAKTKGSKRAAAVPAMLVPILVELAESPAHPDGFLFAMERKGKGKPADRHWVLRAARRTMKGAGVRKVTAQGLRGTAATIGSATTKGAEVMAGALGHTNTTMTKEHYIDHGAFADAQTDAIAGLIDEETVELKSDK